MKIETVVRTRTDLEDAVWAESFVDPKKILHIGDAATRTLGQSPFAEGESVPVQVVGLAENEVVGKINLLRYGIVADGKVYQVVSGSDLFVYEKFRSSLYGLRLLSDLPKFSRDRIVIGCRYSSLAKSILPVLKYSFFPLGHYILRKDIEHFVKSRVHGRLERPAMACANLVVRIWHTALLLLARAKTPGIRMQRIDVKDDDMLSKIEQLVASDGKRFRENISKEWLRWVVMNDLCDKVDKPLYGFFRRNELVGFALARIPQYGKGELLEWQSLESVRNGEPALLMRALLEMSKRCNQSMLMFDASDARMQRYFTGKLFRSKDDFAALKAAPDSPLQMHPGFENPANWRIRPALGDSCFW